MSPLVVVIALIWIAVIILVIKHFLERDKPPTDNYTPSPGRNANEVVKDPGGKGGLLRFLTYEPMSVEFNSEGFPASGSRILISDYYFILPFLYEAGAILGRARRDKIGILRKMLFTMNQNEAYLEKVVGEAEGRLKRYKQGYVGEAEGRLKRYKQGYGGEPETFRDFIMITEHASNTYWCSLKPNTTVSPKEAELYLLSLVLEGIGFGCLFPELTKKMNRKFYGPIEIDWDTWFQPGALAPMTKEFFALPGEPTILSLEGQEQTLLQVVGDYTANFYPELVDPLDLRHYSGKENAFYGIGRYKGWWLVYDSLLLSGHR